MSNNKQKIELELDQETIKKINIISKAFGAAPIEIIKLAIKHEIDYIYGYAASDNAKEELESYYNREIDIKHLVNLILLKEE